jgi:hypothetical protein
MKNIILVTLTLFFSYKTFSQNVGIGTLTPADKLSVVNAQAGYGITHTYGPVTMGSWISNLNGQFGTKTNHPLQFFTNNGDAQITLLQNGDVGFGTSNPLSNLHVDPNGAGSIFIGTNKAAGNYYYNNLEIGITAKSNGYAYLQAKEGPNSVGDIGILQLNPAGGHVGINHADAAKVKYPLDIYQTNYGYGLRLLTTSINNVDYSWDLANNGELLYFSYNGAAKAYFEPTGELIQVSDTRLKKNIAPKENVLDKVMALQPKTYLYTDQKDDEKNITGFLAQEVLPLFPELVSEFKYPKKDTTDTNVYQGINYSGFSVIAIKAIQEQQEIIENLQIKMDKMEKRISALEAKK